MVVKAAIHAFGQGGCSHEVERLCEDLVFVVTERIFPDRFLHVAELLDAPVETREPERESRPDTVRGEIAFDNVTFGYERHRPVLKQVSFQIEPGQRIGIVGRSGSGKTTLVNLSSRFYDVDEGTIRLDGVEK